MTKIKIESKELLTVSIEEYHIKISRQVSPYRLPDGIYATVKESNKSISYLIHDDANCSVDLESVNEDSCIIAFSDGSKKRLKIVLVPELEIE